MSVILDALHKARGDRRSASSEPHEQAVARVVDAGLAPMGPAAVSRPSRRREWLLATAVILVMLLLFAALGGAFLFLYNTIRMQERPVAVADAPSPVAVAGAMEPGGPGMRVAAGHDGVQAPVPAVMPTPLPLSELPVQTPAAAPVAPAASAADFTLGSIVCENNDCIASLNNRSVRVGDTVRGYKIAAIDSTTVNLVNIATNEVLILSLFD